MTDSDGSHRLDTNSPGVWVTWARAYQEAFQQKDDGLWISNLVARSRHKISHLSEDCLRLLGDHVSVLDRIHELLLGADVDLEGEVRAQAAAVVLYWVLVCDEIPDNGRPEGLLDDLALLEHFRPSLDPHLSAH